MIIRFAIVLDKVIKPAALAVDLPQLIPSIVKFCLYKAGYFNNLMYYFVLSSDVYFIYSNYYWHNCHNVPKSCSVLLLSFVIFK